jgi:Caenorhabditis protein of unknown function, DUF268
MSDKKSMNQKVKGPVFDIPAELLQAYTMNGLARIGVDWFYSDSSGEVLNWSTALYEEMKDVVRQASKDRGNVYYQTDYLLPDVFSRYSISGRTVAVIGSATPLYEAYIEHFGGQPLTVEYRPIRHDIKDLLTFTFEEAMEKVKDRSLRSDHALCYSSIEHSGLGRYGDFLDPEGDLLTMEMVRNMVRPGGLFFLQIPVGPDALSWNATRIYGPARLLLLLAGWELVDTFGYQSQLLDGRFGTASESIFVLKNAPSKNSLRALFSNSQVETLQAMEADRSIWQKKLKELSAGFAYVRSEHPRIRYSPPEKHFLKGLKDRLKRYARRALG